MTKFKIPTLLSVEPAHGPGWVVCEPCSGRAVQKIDNSWATLFRTVFCFARTESAAQERRRQLLSSDGGGLRWTSID